jgi:hypothetical protein
MLVLTLALILTFSPQEKEQRLDVRGLMNDHGANPVADIYQVHCVLSRLSTMLVAVHD